MTDATPTSTDRVLEAPTDDRAETAINLDDLVEHHERVDWRAVPGISASEAAAWNARLLEARDELEEGI